MSNFSEANDSLDRSRTFSIDSGYIPALTSNRAFWHFGLEFEGLGSWIFDRANQIEAIGGNIIGRLALAAGGYFAWPYAQYSFFVANHELGHGSRGVALGPLPTYTWENKSTAHTSIFSFFLEGFTTRGGAYASFPGGSIRTNQIPPSFSLQSSAGGMNNSTMFAEALEDQMLVNGGHVLEYVAYARAKEDAYDYAIATEAGVSFASGDTGDITAVRDYYRTQGLDVSYNDIKSASRLSRFLSSTHWAYLWGTVQYLATGNPNVNPFLLGKLKVPDFSFYMMKRGLSAKLRTGYFAKDRHYPLEIEYLYKGEEVIEASIGYRSLQPLGGGRRGGLWIQGYFNSLGALGAKIQKDIAMNKMILSFGGSVYQEKLLEGERNIARYLSANLGMEVWGRLSLIF